MLGSWSRWLGKPWNLVFVLVGVLLLVRNLCGLNASPPGMYIDEASIGYNAWTIAHFGVDEHGHAWPLYFQAFGEYKNPVYIYLLVPFVKVFGLTAAVVRTPAALLGAVTCVAIAGTVWRVTQNKVVTFISLLLAALTPWLTQESRLGFEVISMVAAVSVALYCAARADSGSELWFLGAGFALGMAVYSYTSGRVEAAVLVVALSLCFGLARKRGWWWGLLPVALALMVLFRWNAVHPGALTARFNLISITANGASPSSIISAFTGNYEAQIGFPFLFTHGDGNLRHNTGFGGELLVVTAPFMLWGLIDCVRRWRTPIHSFCLIGFFAAPAAAAVTSDGIPHSLRSATMIPFALVITAIGVSRALQLFKGRNLRLAAVGLTVLVLLEGGTYTWDQFTAYPDRSAVWFDTGVMQMVDYAEQHAHGHHVYLSSDIDQVYIEAFMVSPPRPPATPTTDANHAAGLRQLNMKVVSPAGIATSQPGDLLVLGPGEVAPSGTTVAYRVTASDQSVLAEVVRFR